MRPLALITGAARRLGAVIAERLAHDFDLLIHFRSSEEEADSISKRCAKHGAKVDLIGCDLSELTLIEPVFKTHFAERPASVLVNSAAMFEWDRTASFTPDLFQKQMSVNLAAPILLTKLMAESLPDGQNGAVVNILDQKLSNLNPDHLTYTLAKAGLACFTEMAALEYGARVRVNAVAPGFTLPNPGQTEADMQAQCQENLLGRASCAEDVAEAVAFLIHNPSITGEVIRVDAGARYAKRERDFLFA